MYYSHDNFNGVCCVQCHLVFNTLLMCIIPAMRFSHKLELDLCKTELINGLEISSHTVLASYIANN